MTNTATFGVIQFTVTLPIYARSEANNRDNRFVKAKRAKEQRGVVRAMVHGNASGVLKLAKLITPAPAFTVTLTRVHRKSARPLDDDNLRGSLKAVRDGVADALGIDDGDVKRLKFLYAQEPGRDYAVRVEIASAGSAHEKPAGAEGGGEPSAGSPLVKERSYSPARSTQGIK